MSPKQRTAQRYEFNTIPIGFIFLAVSLLLSACAPSTGNLSQQVGGMSGFVRVVIGVVGLVLLCAGFVVYEILLHITGFIIGGLLGSLLGSSLAGGENLGAIIGFILGGVIGAFLATLLASLAIFLAGAVVGAILLSGLWSGITNTEPTTIVAIIGGLIGGGIFLALYRFWISALTAAFGAGLLGLALGLASGWWILLFLIGLVVQFGVASATGRGHTVRPGYRRAVVGPQATVPPGP
jgi:hypothetical protein